jgi:tripartite-type tricarboxylate transporter receptor subunit TctC
MLIMTRRNTCAALLGCLTAPRAFSAPYPERPVSLLVPYPAGGPTDSVARWLAPALRRELGQPVVIDNVGGASGTLGINKFVNGPTDGYQIMVGSPSETLLAPLALASVKHNAGDLRLIAEIARTNVVLLGKKDLGFNSVAQLIDRLRDSAQRELSYGTFGTGSIVHLMFEDFRAQIGGKAVHIPYKGMPQMMQDMMSGQIDLGFVALVGSTLEFIKSGKVIAYMTTSAGRDPSLPNIPSASEVPALKDFQYTLWGGVFVHPKAPGAIVARLTEAVNAAAKDPQYRAALESSGGTVPPPHTLAQAERFYTAEAQRYLRIAKAIRLEPQ